MAIAHVQTVGTKWFGGSGTTQSVTLTVAANNLLYIAFGHGNAASISSVAGNSNTYNAIGNRVDGTTGTIRHYYVTAANSGSTNVTITWGSDPSFGYLTVTEVSGCDAVSPLDVHTVGTAAIPLVGVVTSGNITTTAAGDMVLGSVFDESGGSTFTVGSGFTIPSGGNQSTTGATEYQIQSSAGSIAATFGSSAAFEVCMVAAAAFKAAGGGGGATVDPAVFSQQATVLGNPFYTLCRGLLLPSHVAYGFN